MRRSTVLAVCVGGLFLSVGMMLLAAYRIGATATESVGGKPSSSLGLRGSVMDPPLDLADFTLPSTHGEDFTLSSYQGKIVLLFFGYTTCPDVCPTTLSTLARAYEELGDLANQVVVVFVSSDPEHENLEQIAAYLHRFNPNFIGLRGERQYLEDIAAQFYAVAGFPVHDHHQGSDEIMHTASVMLIDPEGRWIARFPNGTSYLDMAHDVRKILGLS